MSKKAVSTQELTIKDIHNILVTHKRPSGDRSPYFDLEEKYQVSINFEPLVNVVPIPSKEFRKQKINILDYSAIVFMSKNAINNFFRTLEELKIATPAEWKYFCITKSVALYLKKFIQYRKRKIFYGDDGSNQNLFDTIKKYKEQERFLYPCSEAFDSEITTWMEDHNFDYAVPVLYKVESTDIRELLSEKDIQIFCILTPLSVRSFMENYPDFKREDGIIAVFGDGTRKAALAAGLEPEIVAPTEKIKNMAAALDDFLEKLPKE